VTDDRREQEIRDLITRRQSLPYVRAQWLLAEFDAARMRLAAVEIELDEMRTGGLNGRPQALPVDVPRVSDEGPEWLTVEECARAAGIHRSLVYELVKRGELKPARRFGRLIRIHRDALHVAAQRTVR
jgi:excisionase family DNA binding protein